MTLIYIKDAEGSPGGRGGGAAPIEVPREPLVLRWWALATLSRGLISSGCRFNKRFADHLDRTDAVGDAAT